KALKRCPCDDDVARLERVELDCRPFYQSTTVRHFSCGQDRAGGHVDAQADAILLVETKHKLGHQWPTEPSRINTVAHWTLPVKPGSPSRDRSSSRSES